MERILVVDDTRGFRIPVATALRKQGYEVVEAENGVAALESLKAETPQLILLDVSMPEMDGITFLNQLNSFSAYKTTPVIFLTALANQESVSQAANTRTVDCLIKSQFSLEELLDKVRTTLKSSQN